MMTLSFAKTTFIMKAGRTIMSSLILSFSFFLTSCNGSSSQLAGPDAASMLAAHTNPEVADGASEEPFTIDTELYTLYIENRAGSEQLKKLLGENQKQKLVLQLYRGTAGYLRLIIFPSTNGNGQYFLADTVQPKPSNVIATRIPAGQDIFFGDLQIANRQRPLKWTIRDLKAHLYDPNTPGQNAGWEYIWLVPKIAEITEGSFRRKYIIYELHRSNEIPRKTSLQSLNRAAPLEDEANPSPPRKLE